MSIKKKGFEPVAGEFAFGTDAFREDAFINFELERKLDPGRDFGVGYIPPYKFDIPDLNIAAAPAETVTEPGYTNDTLAQNSVIHHVAPVNTYLERTRDGLELLRKGFGAGEDDEEDTLTERFNAYVDDFIRSDRGRELFPEHEAELPGYFNAKDLDKDTKRITPKFNALVGIDEVIKISTKDKEGDEKPVSDNSLVHTTLFKAGQYLLDDTLISQRLRHAVVRIRRDRAVELNQKRRELAKLHEEIARAHKQLAVDERTRLESLGDYHLAQQLVSENWAEVEQRYADRKAVLDAHHGIYYTRVRETPASLTLPDPLPLRNTSPGDLLPGCGVQDKDLPEELEPFVEAVLDIPMGDWAGLRDQYHLLPGRQRLDTLYGQRRVRLDHRLQRSTQGQGSGKGLRLAGLRVQNISLLQDLVRRPVVQSVSLRDYQLRSRDLLSLEDLLTGTSHRLLGQASELRDQLSQASHCLLERLRKLPTGIRVAWAEGADGDRDFIVEQPERWPRLDQAEAQDFNTVRTLVEVVNWWFRQLHAEAAGHSLSAMRNMVRACLLLSASDDPEDILHGQLKTVPGRFNIGEAMRLTLNHEAVPGTRLRLLDTQDRLVGTLRVDDEDDQGTIATVTQILDSSAILATGYRVTGYRLDTTGVE